jgi:CMP-N-acetylneuraminic acid synthetase
VEETFTLEIFSKRYTLLHALQHFFTSRVIQKAFDELGNRDVASLISAFKGNVLPCLNDHNGKRVLRIT